MGLAKRQVRPSWTPAEGWAKRQARIRRERQSRGLCWCCSQPVVKGHTRCERHRLLRERK